MLQRPPLRPPPLLSRQRAMRSRTRQLILVRFFVNSMRGGDPHVLQNIIVGKSCFRNAAVICRMATTCTF
jgi:hypothetical protein